MQNFCPNCNQSLDDNVIMTKESKIFKGHNVYCMCKNCGYVMVYNPDRDLIFSLERFKDDPDILKELQDLLSEEKSVIDLNESKDPVECTEKKECNGDCEKCSSKNESIDINIGDLLVKNKETGVLSILSKDSLDKINIDNYEFYELNPIIIKRIVTYEIEHV